MEEPQSQQALYSAVVKLLRPLTRFLLRNGVTYSAFADLAKFAFADVAMKEFSLQGKKQTYSRVATITGLSRKEVQRLLTKNSDDEDVVSIARYNRAARVVFGWVHDERFHTPTGDTALLRFEGTTPSFSGLVKLYSGDMPPRAILDELLQVGVVRRDEQDNIRLLAPAYIPTASTPEKLALLGRDVAGLISTMDRNIHGIGAKPYFQRKVFYDNMPHDAVTQLQEILAHRGQELLQYFDQWMAQHDRDVNPDVQGTGRTAAGIGLYYFEEELNKDETGRNNDVPV